MDGRCWIVGLAVLSLGLPVGCTHTETMPEQTGLPQPNPERKSLFEQTNLFGNRSQSVQVPGSPIPVPVVTSPNNSGSLKPETDAAFADADVEAAFSPDRSSVDRDRLLDRARQRYQLALKKDEKNKAALAGLARMYVKGGDKDRAAETLQSAMRYHPEDHEIPHRLATTYIQFADWPAAITACKQALAGDPENRTYMKTLGYCQAVNGDWEEAFGTMLSVLPEAEARYFLGRVLGDLERYDDARLQMTLALQADPQYDQARVYLGKLDSSRPQSRPTAGVEPQAIQE